MLNLQKCLTTKGGTTLTGGFGIAVSALWMVLNIFGTVVVQKRISDLKNKVATYHSGLDPHMEDHLQDRITSKETLLHVVLAISMLASISWLIANIFLLAGVRRGGERSPYFLPWLVADIGQVFITTVVFVGVSLATLKISVPISVTASIATLMAFVSNIYIWKMVLSEYKNVGEKATKDEIIESQNNNA